MALATLDPLLFLDQTAGDQRDESPFDNTLLTTWGFSDDPSDYAVKTFNLTTDGISFRLQDDTVTNTGLTALDGTEILLSAAKTAANGATYFEAYLNGDPGTVAYRLVYEPIVDGEGLISGYELHALLYNDVVQIQHGDATDPDDLASMQALVEVVARSDFQFVFTDFSGIPAGQQAFGVLNEPSLDPDPSPGASNDVVITSKVYDSKTEQWLDSTINTSNVAGAASAIGVGSQAVNTNEVVIYDFVTDASYLDSRDLSTLETGGAVAVNRAFSTVTQLNPNNANTRADVKVWLRDGNPGDAVFDGDDNVGIKTVSLYLNGDYSTPAYTISSADGPTWSGPSGSGLSVTFTNSDGDAAYEYAVIKGLTAGDRFEVEGDEQFNRLVVGNDGTGNRSFDLGVTGYSISNSEFDGTLLGGIGIYDDGPTVEVTTAAADTLVLDESAPGSDPDGPGNAAAGTSSASANFADNFDSDGPTDYGTDGAGSVSYALVLDGTGVASGLYALDPTDTVDTDGDGIGQGAQILLNYDGNDVVGSTGGTEYFRLSVDNDPLSGTFGTVTFARSNNIWHSDTTSDDDAETLSTAAGALTLEKTVVDADGDSESAAVDLSGAFSIEDDGPAFLFPAGETSVDLISATGSGAIQTGEFLNWDPGTDGFRTITLANFNGSADPGNGGFSHEVTSVSPGSISIDISYGGQRIATHVFNADVSDSFTTYNYQGEVVIEPTELEAGAAVKAGGPHPLEFRLFPDPQDLAIMVTGGTRTAFQDETDPFTAGQLNTSAQGYAAGNTNQNLEFGEAIKFTFTDYGPYPYDQLAANAATDFKAGTYSDPELGIDIGAYKPLGGFGFDITKLTGGAKVADLIAKATFSLETGTQDVYWQFENVGVGKQDNPKVFVGYDAITGWTAYTWKDANGNSLRDPGEVANGTAAVVNGADLPDMITGLAAVEIYNNEVDGETDTFNVTNPRFYSQGTQTEIVPEFNYSFDLILADSDFDTTAASITAMIEGQNTDPLTSELLLGQSSLV